MHFRACLQCPVAVAGGSVGGTPFTKIPLDAQAAASLELTIGGMYEIAVFQAERLTVGSDYQLTLAGFVHARSECTGHCGDGVVTGDEICDDGEECDGSRDCAPGCKRLSVK